MAVRTTAADAAHHVQTPRRFHFTALYLGIVHVSVTEDTKADRCRMRHISGCATKGRWQASSSDQFLNRLVPRRLPRGLCSRNSSSWGSLPSSTRQTSSEARYIARPWMDGVPNGAALVLCIISWPCRQAPQGVMDLLMEERSDRFTSALTAGGSMDATEYLARIGTISEK